MINPLSDRVSSVRPLFQYLKKQKENKRFVKSVEISATFTLITFFLYFALRPTFLTISKLKGDIESKKILTTELKKKITNVIQAQDLYSQIQERYLVVNSALPDKPAFFQSAYQVQKSAEANGLPGTDLVYGLDTTKDGQVDTGVKSYSIRLNIDGNYNNAVDMATNLLNNRRVVDIKSLNFMAITDKSVASASATEKVNSSFTSTFYYWPITNEKK